VTSVRRRDPLGYGIVVLSYLGMAGSAPLAPGAARRRPVVEAGARRLVTLTGGAAR